MTRRNFPNFLEAYFEYAQDQHCPDRFHFWTGVLGISMMLERKCFIRRGHAQIFPNVYIMYVGSPGSGKSTALMRGVDLLKRVRSKDEHFRILPNQVSMEKLIVRMSDMNSIAIPGTRVIIPQSAALYFASEASNSIRNVSSSDLLPLLIELYDCNDYERETLGKRYEITKPCLTLGAATTFSYLSTLISGSAIAGGFASRLLYIIEETLPERDHSWDQKIRPDKTAEENFLIEDLLSIGKLNGEFQLVPSLKARWKEWSEVEDIAYREAKSDRKKDLIVRKGTNLLKLLMIFSAATSDDLIIRESHWEAATGLLAAAMKEVDLVLSRSEMFNTSSSRGLQQIVLRTIRESGNVIELKHIRRAVFAYGHKPIELDPLMKMLAEAEMIRLEVPSGGGPTQVHLLVDPNDYL